MQKTKSKHEVIRVILNLVQYIHIPTFYACEKINVFNYLEILDDISNRHQNIVFG